MIELTLPYPISANRYWRTYLPRGCAAPVTTVSPEARAYQDRVRRAARGWRHGKRGFIALFPVGSRFRMCCTRNVRLTGKDVRE